MGENPKKYHITDDGDVYRINDDGSFTSMGNVSTMHSDQTPIGNATEHSKKNADGKTWMRTNNNWLNVISLLFLLLNCIICIGLDAYSLSIGLGALSLCIGTVAILIPWKFTTMSKGVIIVFFSLLLASALICSIVFTQDAFLEIQIVIGFVSILCYILYWVLRKKSIY